MDRHAGAVVVVVVVEEVVIGTESSPGWDEGMR